MATLVKFYIDTDNEVLAVFPQLKYNKRMYGNDMLTGYAHLGQHTSVHKDYCKELRPAQAVQFSDLHSELLSIGYNLKITNA